MPKLESVTATAFKQAVGEYGDMARKNPVIVTKHQRPWLVVMDPDEYQRLKSLETRKSYYVHELSDEFVSDLENAEMDPKHHHLDALMK